MGFASTAWEQVPRVLQGHPDPGRGGRCWKGDGDCGREGVMAMVTRYLGRRPVSRPDMTGFVGSLKDTMSKIWD